MVSLSTLWIFFALCLIDTQCTVFGIQLEVIPPNHFLAAPGQNITFTCLTIGNIGIQEINWRFNGSPLENLELSIVQTDFSPFANGIGRLIITEVPVDFNGTTVQCNTPLSTGHSVESNVASILILNDLVADVGSLTLTAQSSIISLSWEAPISSTPLTYCVTVRNSTAETIVETLCGINDTSFTYPLPERSYCDIYLFEVYPVNENGNIGAETIRSYVGTQTRPMMITSSLRTDAITYVLTLSAPVCSAELTLVNIDTGRNITLGGTDLTMAETNITFNTQQLSKNHKYDVNVTASNVHGQAQSVFNLSTHGVETANISYIGQDDEISIVVDYYWFSTESGALISLINHDINTNVVNFTRSVTLALNRSESLNYVLPFQLFPGRYRIFVYDIEEDGTLNNGVGYPAAASGIRIVRSNNRGIQQPFKLSDKCSVYSSFNLIISECTLSNSALTGIQMIAQLNDSEVGKIYATKTIDDLQTTPSVQVEENGLYLVTIILITRSEGITNFRVELRKQLEVSNKTTTEPTVPPIDEYPLEIIVPLAVVGFTLSVALVIVLLSFVAVTKRKKRKSVAMNYRSTPMNDPSTNTDENTDDNDAHYNKFIDN